MPQNQGQESYLRNRIPVIPPLRRCNGAS